MNGLQIAGAVVGLVGGAAGAITGGWATLNYKRIERTKADIGRVAFEHQTRFSRLHQQRVEVLAEMYRRLVRTERKFADLIHPLQMAGDLPIDEKAKGAVEAGNAFRDYFSENRIWLDQDLVAQIADFDGRISTAFIKWQSAQQGEYQVEMPTKVWKEAWDEVRETVPKLRESIEARFRMILGVESANNPQTSGTQTADTDG